MTPGLAAALRMKSATGALVTAVDAQGPAAGTLMIGDVLLKAGSSPVTFKNLSKITARLAPGALTTLVILRSGAQQSVAMKIGTLPEPASDPTMTGGRDTWVPALWLGVADTTSEIRRKLKANDEPTGLIVTQLRPAGPGALAGLKVGDLITHAGTKQLIGVADITAVADPTDTSALEKMIDEVIAASAESCLVRRQKRRQFSDLFSGADTSQRMGRAESRERVFSRQVRREVCRGPCQHRCADRARADRIDANIVGGMVECQSARQTVNRPF